MIDLNKLTAHRLQTVPFSWAQIGALYTPDDAKALA